MRFSIYASPRSGHQMPSADALKAGLEKHGHEAVVTNEGPDPEADVAVVWGWRTGARAKQHHPGRDVLVMERSYVKDRFHWTSFGWNGLNGHAAFFVPEGRPERWDAYFADQIAPERTGGDYALILGQVHGDASLRTCSDLEVWYAQQAHRWTALGVPVFFRDHPKAKGRWAPHIPRRDGDLAEALAGAHSVIAWNSNGLVDAALAGYCVYAGDPGTMAYPVCNLTSPYPRKPTAFNRLAWARDLAWTQWTLDEVASGLAIPIILAGCEELPFNKRRGEYNVPASK